VIGPGQATRTAATILRCRADPALPGWSHAARL